MISLMALETDHHWKTGWRLPLIPVWRHYNPNSLNRRHTMKRSFTVFLFILLFLISCAHKPQPAPPPKERVKTEFLLVGHRSPAGQPHRSQEALEKKNEIY